jgi:hypothetical protein
MSMLTFLQRRFRAEDCVALTSRLDELGQGHVASSGHGRRDQSGRDRETARAHHHPAQPRLEPVRR